jgi:hypothetical protein
MTPLQAAKAKATAELKEADADREKHSNAMHDAIHRCNSLRSDIAMLEKWEQVGRKYGLLPGTAI